MKLIKALSFCLIVLLSINSSVNSASLSGIQSPILYVKPGGSGDCSSWGDACALQSALSLAVSGDQIWVAMGTYLPAADSNPETTFQLISGVSVFGGFPTDGGEWNERDWDNTTILSGDIGTPGVNTDNSRHVVTGSGVDSSAILDGFIIRDGYAFEGSSYQENAGAGMFNLSGSPTLSNLAFTGNRALLGSAMYNYYSAPNLTDISFSETWRAQMAGGCLMISVSR